MVGKFLAVNADIHRAGADVAAAGYGYDHANGFLWKISGIGRRKNDREKMLKVMFQAAMRFTVAPRSKSRLRVRNKPQHQPRVAYPNLYCRDCAKRD